MHAGEEDSSFQACGDRDNARRRRGLFISSLQGTQRCTPEKKTLYFKPAGGAKMHAGEAFKCLQACETAEIPAEGL